MRWHKSQKKSIEPMWKSFGKKKLLSSPPPRSRQLRKTIMESKNPDVKFILEAFVGSLLALTAEGNLLLEDEQGGQLRTRLTRCCQKIIKQTHPCSPTRCYVREPAISAQRRQQSKAGGRNVVRKTSQTPQKASMTDSSIASSTSIQDSSPSSCWQGASNTSRQLSTTLIKSARWRCTPTESSFKESEVDNLLHKNDHLKTQNAQELSDDCTRTTIEKPERPRRIPRNTTESRTDIGTQKVFTDSSDKQENLVTPCHHSPQAWRPHEKRRGTIASISTRAHSPSA